MTEIAFSLRAATDADYDFMRLLYHSSRDEEMKLFPFTEEQKLTFLDWQFQCQWAHYREHYPTCDWKIIEIDGAPVGRLLVDRWSDQIRIVDVALMTGARGKGVGSRLMREVMAEGKAAGKPVTIHVEVFNPAQQLYKRLGFEQADSSGAYHLMRWTPDQVNTAS
ncbi:MAG TPA: GNAT family N-acetyltransferase [Thermoanaerobaculia bacterium]